MTPKQLKSLMETIELIESCRKTIDKCCTEEIAPDDPEANEASGSGSYPAWMPNDVCDKFNAIWGDVDYMKFKIKDAKRLLDKYEKEIEV